MSKTINFTLKKDDDGNYKIHYECNGFEGSGCDNIAEIMATMGQMSDKKTTDDVHTREIPVPVPNQTFN